MADDARSEDVRRRLHGTASAPTGSPDLDGIRRRIGRRRLARRGVAGLAALVLVSGLAVAALDENRADDTSEVEVVDDPGTTVPSETDDEGDDDAAPDDLGSTGALGPEGVAIQTDVGVELRALDGSLLRTLEGYELATEDRSDGLMSTVTNVVPLRGPGGSLHWFDPASGLATVVSPDGGTPLWYGRQLGFDPEHGLRTAGSELWFPTDSWMLSSDHRVVSVLGEGIFDSATGSSPTYLPDCWVAARAAERDAVVCEEDGRSSVAFLRGGAGEGVLVPDGTDGEPRRVTASWLAEDDVVVRTEQASCFIADGMVLRSGELVPLLGPDITALPSSAPIGIAADGRAIVHLNSAACDAAADDMGVHLVDLETGEREPVWEGPAQLWEVRAWTTLPLADEDAEDKPSPSTDDVGPDGEPITPEEIGRDLLEFGDEGIRRWVDGEERPVWGQPVAQAFHDGAGGGVVFQDAGEWGAIHHLPAGAREPQRLVPSSDNPVLWGLMRDVDGGAEAWFTRREMPPDDPTGQEETLYARTVRGGQEVRIGVSGAYESWLDGIARLGDGRTLFSTCHLRCRIVDSLDGGATEAEQFPGGWIGGLDGAADSVGYVRFDDVVEGQPTEPFLEVRAPDGTIRHEVALPAAIGWMTHVDLSDDGAAALVWSVPHDGDEVDGPVYVTGLDTDEPTVHPVETDQAVRFS